MANIKAFNALRYNKAKIKDIARVTCPPYDVINPDSERAYRSQDSHNIINLILPQGFPDQDKYSKAAEDFNHWLNDAVFLKDARDGIYFLRQTFLSEGVKRSRLGFIALLRVSEDRSVIPHEHTDLAPKEDRLQLVRKVRANLSPIFVLFKDRKNIIGGIFNQHISRDNPLLKFRDIEGVDNELWHLEDKGTIGRIVRMMRKKPIFIADGHHRFEVSCNYLKEQEEADPDLKADAPVNFIMSYFTNTESDGLVIMPIHRLIRSVDKGKLDNLDNLLTKYFTIKNNLSRQDAFSLLGKSRNRRCAFILYREKTFSFLRLKNSVILDRIISIDKPKEFKALDVAIFNALILKCVLGISSPEPDKIFYMHDAREAIAEVDSGGADLLFMLNPIRIRQLLKVASKFEKMPPKSTFFYPKILTGLTIHKF